MNFEEIVPSVCQKTGMWVSPPTFRTATAFFQGYDMARDGGPLHGFREWLVVQYQGADNIYWTRLAEMVLGITDQQLAAEDQKEILMQLSDLMEEFFAYRKANGVVVIFDDYRRWLLKNKWYDGPLRKTKKAAKK
jgi:hypothetical protein